MMAVRSEDEFGVKVDRCVADLVTKFCGGVLVGSAFSLVFFKRRMWPITFGMGIGVGMACANCQRSFDEPYLVRADKVQMHPASQLNSIKSSGVPS